MFDKLQLLSFSNLQRFSILTSLLLLALSVAFSKGSILVVTQLIQMTYYIAMLQYDSLVFLFPFQAPFLAFLTNILYLFPEILFKNTFSFALTVKGFAVYSCWLSLKINFFYCYCFTASVFFVCQFFNCGFKHALSIGSLNTLRSQNNVKQKCILHY